MANGTNTGLICHTWALSSSGAAVSALPAPLTIDAESSCEARVQMPLSSIAGSQRTFAEIVGPGVRCVVEAAVPSLSGERARALWRLSGCAVAAGAAMLVTVLRLALQHRALRL